MPQPATQRLPVRVRKAHRKSRHGCGNCKLRRVKCDESKPHCAKCLAYGVTCNYGTTASPGSDADMQLSLAGAFAVDLKRPLLAPPLRLPVAGPRGSAMYEMTPLARSLVHKFQTRTIFTVGTAMSSDIFQHHMLRVAIANPFFLHVILALTLLHDQHLSSIAPTRREATALAFHWYHGTALFNAKLSEPLQSSERDALWGAAALMGTAAFADVSARSPEEAWPLLPPAPNDLDWLRMSDGKRAVWKIANPLRHDSVFSAMAMESVNHISPTPRVGPEINDLPNGFVALYALDENSTPESNPYHSAATLLAQVMPLECNRQTILRFLSFAMSLDAPYQALLGERDPKALLLLACWYAKVLTYHQWWIWRRAVLEGPAICLYIERVCKPESEVRQLLAFPKAVFGMA